jgi:hypothetical protein
MKALILSLIASGGLLLPLGGSALAASSNHTAGGAPGDKNCVGQTNAFFAQGAQNFDIPIQPGIGNLSSAANLSVKEYKELVASYCEG